MQREGRALFEKKDSNLSLQISLSNFHVMLKLANIQALALSWSNSATQLEEMAAEAE